MCCTPCTSNLQLLQARGVQYDPLTAGYTAPTPSPPAPVAAPAPVARPAAPTTASRPATTTGSSRPRPVTASSSSTGGSSSSASTDACACTMTGQSGSAFVPALGCQQHGLAYGDTAYFCYATGGRTCSGATASNSYPGELGREMLAVVVQVPPQSQTVYPAAG